MSTPSNVNKNAASNEAIAWSLLHEATKLLANYESTDLSQRQEFYAKVNKAESRAAPELAKTPSGKQPQEPRLLPTEYEAEYPPAQSQEWNMAQPKIGDTLLRFVAPCCGYEFLANDCPVKWNEFNKVVQCHNCGRVATLKP